MSIEEREQLSAGDFGLTLAAGGGRVRVGACHVLSNKVRPPLCKVEIRKPLHHDTKFDTFPLDSWYSYELLVGRVRNDTFSYRCNVGEPYWYTPVVVVIVSEQVNNIRVIIGSPR